MLLGLIPVAIIIALAATIGLKGMSGLLSTLDKATDPNTNLLAIQRIKSELFRAESAVRTSKITGIDTLLGVDDAKIAADSSIALLRLAALFNPARVDSLQLLVDQKFDLLDQLASLESYRTAKVLESVRQELGTGETAEARSTQTEVSNRRKPKKKELQAKLDLVIAELDSLLEVRTAERDYLVSYIEQLEDRESQQRNLDLVREQELTIEDVALSQQILAILADFEQTELQREAAVGTEGARIAEEATRSVRTGTAAAGLLLLGLAIAIFLQLRQGERYQTALRDNVERERAWVKTRESFLATMSHELRTPLHAILGFTGRLRKHVANKEGEEYLGIIDRSGKHLRDMVDGWLEYAREDVVSTANRRIPFSPVALVRDVCTWMQPQADARGLKLILESKSEPGLELMGDPVRVRGILLNLIGNAIKYTPEGEVRITEMTEARKKRSGRGKSSTRLRWTIAVADTGVGIPKEAQELSFERVQMVEGSEQAENQPASSGLGLAITRNLVEKLGGKLRLDSTPGVGSTFTVELNLPSSQEAESGDSTAKTPARSLAGLRILVADDEPYNRKLIKAILESRDIKTSIVSGGLDAVDSLSREQFDLMLLDWRMPDLDAVGVYQSLAEKGISIPPSAVLTASTEPDVVEMLEAAGFDTVLSKPFEDDDLFALIEKLVPPSRLSNERAVDNPEPSNGGTEPETPDDNRSDVPESLREERLDLAGLKAASGDDDAFVEEMLLMFRDNLEEFRTEWSNFRAKSQEADSNLRTEFAEKVHKMSAPCRHLGLVETANELRGLERNLRDGEEIPDDTQLDEIQHRLEHSDGLVQEALSNISAKADGSQG